MNDPKKVTFRAVDVAHLLADAAEKSYHNGAVEMRERIALLCEARPEHCTLAPEIRSIVPGDRAQFEVIKARHSSEIKLMAQRAGDTRN